MQSSHFHWFSYKNWEKNCTEKIKQQQLIYHNLSEKSKLFKGIYSKTCCLCITHCILILSTLSDFMQTNFFYLGRFLKKLVDDQCSSITKGSIYHINHMYIQPFNTVVDWSEIWWLMEVSTMVYICRYYVFTWGGRTTSIKAM